MRLSMSMAWGVMLIGLTLSEWASASGLPPENPALSTLNEQGAPPIQTDSQSGVVSEELANSEAHCGFGLQDDKSTGESPSKGSDKPTPTNTPEEAIPQSPRPAFRSLGSGDDETSRSTSHHNDSKGDSKTSFEGETSGTAKKTERSLSPSSDAGVPAPTPDEGGETPGVAYSTIRQRMLIIRDSRAQGSEHSGKQLKKRPQLVRQSRQQKSPSSSSEDQLVGLHTMVDTSDSGEESTKPLYSKAAPHRKGKKGGKQQPTKAEQLQILRTVQLLNILIKQQKQQAMEHAGPRGARINPTKMAVSYEDLLTKVYKHRDSSADEKEEDSEEGLSWAAALILAVPPSLLAIILAHHIAKRQAGPTPAERRRELVGSQGRFEDGARDFKAHSDSDYSIDDELLRAEAEAASYAEYKPRWSRLLQLSSRMGRGAPISKSFPKYWTGRNRHADFYSKIREPFPGEFEDAFEHAQRRRKSARPIGYNGGAMPLSHGYADVDEFDLAWGMGAPSDFEDTQEFRMHGGL